MASACAATDSDSIDDPGVIVQQLGEERGQGLVAIKSYAKGETVFREKVNHCSKYGICAYAILKLTYKIMLSITFH